MELSPMSISKARRLVQELILDVQDGFLTGEGIADRLEDVMIALDGDYDTELIDILED